VDESRDVALGVTGSNASRLLWRIFRSTMMYGALASAARHQAPLYTEILDK